jgi:hypothetical protein
LFLVSIEWDIGFVVFTVELEREDDGDGSPKCRHSPA